MSVEHFPDCLQVFWAALGELSAAQFASFLKKLTSASEWFRADPARSDCLLHGGSVVMPGGAQLSGTFRFHVRLRPSSAGEEKQSSALTSMDLLPISAEQEGVALLPGDLCLCVPRYSSLNVALHHLVAFSRAEKQPCTSE